MKKSALHQTIKLLIGMNFSQIRSFLLLFILLSLSNYLFSQPPSHDPSRIIKNNDGRYWVFTTGQGIWCMSASNTEFSDWQAEPTPFGNSYPSWIDNYVSGFTGFFWAPDIIKIGSTYYLYYSCAGEGAPAAIGLVTAPGLNGPWTDQGMVVAGNNAIDPGLLIDGSNLWMTWGNWQSGIDIIQLDPSTGKRLNSTTYHQITGEVEGPALLKNDNYYYLFYQRGLCCNGVNSTYYVVVARSTSVTGPYTGERVFLPNKDGNIIGPGHIGYGEGKLTYHYYDGNDNGNAKLMITTLGYVEGWPVAGGSNDEPPITNDIFEGTYSIIASHSGKALDVYDWGTSDGTNINQWDYWGGTVQQFNIAPVGGIWHRITPVIATDKALDVNNISTDDGANIQIYNYWGGYGQQFRFQQAGSGVWRIINRNSDKCIDVENSSTENGANVIQWTCISGSHNQMFSLVDIKNAGNGITRMLSNRPGIYPNPVYGKGFSVNTTLQSPSDVKISIFNSLGQIVSSEELIQQSSGELDHYIEVPDLISGCYILRLETGTEIYTDKLLVSH